MLRFLALIAACALTGCEDQAGSGGVGSRDQIRVVGSSTVFPFTALAAEQFVDRNPNMKPPVIESTGTGAGLRLFCAGIGAGHPDIADASRRITASEYAQCKAHGAGALIEVQIGLDGIAFAQAKGGPTLTLSPLTLYRAIAAKPGGVINRARTWRDVDPALPAVAIQVYGPPATSGTRDALAQLILARGCEEAVPEMARKRDSDPNGYAAICTAVREDGAYVDAGENDNLIVQKLRANPDAVGIFGYSYLEENKDTVDGLPLSGVAPTYETIAEGRYPGSRPLFLYAKKAHLGAIKGLRSFLATYAGLWTPDGPMVRKGLIAAPPEVRARAADTIRHETTLDPAGLR
ncbi:substrate-binding domain-containing protein [Sphingomonas sp. AR_OL41]|uniref:substrate-binding domain-containing protein n=1 Tax=Sphingomonas sp. AR_OL41 TaxID=3042729 RepID=UPI00248172AC|nr:substrate-binding domain-containing protein [Sphingomonas sp. AR_OL41]MDH7973033.1 substrate-binding domain-containing protein [Sphingomonas sp. AR_OL41]